MWPSSPKVAVWQSKEVSFIELILCDQSESRKIGGRGLLDLRSAGRGDVYQIAGKDYATGAAPLFCARAISISTVVLSSAY